MKNPKLNHNFLIKDPDHLGFIQDKVYYSEITAVQRDLTSIELNLRAVIHQSPP